MIKTNCTHCGVTQWRQNPRLNSNTCCWDCKKIKTLKRSAKKRKEKNRKLPKIKCVVCGNKKNTKVYCDEICKVFVDHYTVTPKGNKLAPCYLKKAIEMGMDSKKVELLTDRDLGR